MTFLRESAVKAVRKAHQCEGCHHRIEVGQPAIRLAGMTDGEFSTVIHHPECREAEIALNKLHDTRSDEWMCLADMEWDDHPWLLAEYPVIAARWGITTESIRRDFEEQERCRKAWADMAAKRHAKIEEKSNG